MVTALIVLSYIVFCLVLLAGVLMAALGLGGTFVILADVLIFAACNHFERPHWVVLVVLAVICVIAETSDNFFSLLATKYGGGSSRTGLWAMGGGLVGALAGGALAPVIGSLGLLGGVVGFLIGVVIVPLAGALAGGYFAAYWYETQQGRTPEEAKRAGKGAVIGRLIGGAAKGLFAVLMVAITLYAVF